MYKNMLKNFIFVAIEGLKSVPLFGLSAYLLRSCSFICRRHFSSELLLRDLNGFNKDNTTARWFIIYPEADIYSPVLISASEKAALDHNLPVLKYHLTPRSKGSFLILKSYRQHIDAVYDITIVYERSVYKNGKKCPPPRSSGFLLSSVLSYVYIHLRRIPIEEVPTDENEFKKWLHQLFVQKDRVVSPFYSPDPLIRESALKGSTQHKVPLRETLPSFAVTTLILVAFLSTNYGRWIYLYITIAELLIQYSWFSIELVIEKIKWKNCMK